MLQTPAHLNQLTRNRLEGRAIEGDSPVGVHWKDDSEYLEYRALDMARESGSHLLPTLNTTRDR